MGATEVPDKLTIRLHTLNDEVRERLHKTFSDIEHRLSIEGIGYALYYLTLELIGNAVRANLKRIYFRKNGFDLANPEAYHRGLESFRREMISLLEVDYARALQELDLTVNVDVDIDHQRLLIFVENNCTLLPEEEFRIRTKLAQIRDVKDIMEFSVHYGDDSEGKGLGLAMTVLLIKDLGFDPGLFRVFRKGEKTVARVEFPLSADYTPIRQRAQQQGLS